MTPDTPIADLSFYCKRIAKKLGRLELEVARDLLFYYPFRYDDFSRIKKIKDLLPGEAATIRGRVELLKNYLSPRAGKKITEAIISDDSGKIKVLWFNQWYLSDIIKIGEEYFFTAKISDKFYGNELISPDYERASDTPTHSGRLVPIYPATEGISQKEIRTAVKSALPAAETLSDYLPEEIIAAEKLLPLNQAAAKIHFPASAAEAAEARRRLAFNELFFTHLKNLWLKKDAEQKQAAPLAFHKEKIAAFVASLPFRLTESQRKAAWEILKDVGRPHPMSRLLNGDVGSGKTIVAALAMYNAALCGNQSALLAPTEILATQHYNTFCKLFDGLNIKIGLVTHSKKISNFKLPLSVIPDAEAKRRQCSGIQKNNLDSRLPTSLLDDQELRGTGRGAGRGNDTKKNAEEITLNSDIVIGTHALIQENIKFKNLALAIIDEQHRFGVEQRAAIAATAGGGLTPHLLSMTATPIPRTLAIIRHGNLDISILNEMPAGRQKIKTYAVRPEKRAGAYKFIKKQIADGRQVFVICPLIDPSDKLGSRSVTEEYEKLKNKIFPDIPIGMLHGRQKSAEKDEAMMNFKNNLSKILISTSVVEVGVDIPNATIMMIEGAERFGLSQLHQFRGRVGRGEYQSYCLLFSSDGAEFARIKAMENIYDGFRLAEIDLKLRGPGAICGTEQSGREEYRLADLNNIIFVKKTRDAAEGLLQDDPELKKYPPLRKYLEENLKNIHLE